MKIVVPIMPTSLEEAQALELSRFEGADIIEWRADFLDKHSILTVAPAIFEKFAGFEIVFTIRTTREGGKIELTDGEYVTLIKDVAAIYSPDYIDFEYFTRKEVFDQMLEFSNLVLSYHNFEETPENLMELLSEMTNLTPRVVKVAVMPKNEQDVLDLMNFTRGFKAFNPEQEFVTMSMGKIELTDGEYVTLIKDVAAIYSPDYIDFEYFTRKEVFDQMLEFSNLVLSYHNFEETPENLMELLSEMTNLTPRVVKVAVMPKNEQDVLDLMNFTRGFKAFNPEQEFVTMSMGKLGRLSRLAGDLVGSSWTFASLDNTSAPGQVALADMCRIREVLDAD